MGDKSAIEWTDATWNPTVGCSVVSPGCTNCYAMRVAHRLARVGASIGAKYADLTRMSKAGPVWTGAVRLDEHALLQPLRWKRGRRIFVNSMSDLFHEDLPDEAIDRVFAVMAAAPQHTFQILTKRARRMRDYLAQLHDEPAQDTVRRLARAWPERAPAVSVEIPLANAWLGVSVEDQARAEARIPHLLETPAAVRFLSIEPLLGELNLLPWLDPTGACCGGNEMAYCPGCPSNASWRYSQPTNDEMGCEDPQISWVVVGGESGRDARPMHPDWARSLRDQCIGAGVPFFFKQWGEWRPSSTFIASVEGPDDDAPADFHWPDGPVIGWPDGTITGTGHAADHGGEGFLISRVGKRAAGREIDGRTWDEMPRRAA